jgi:hypothetical protein
MKKETELLKELYGNTPNPNGWTLEDLKAAAEATGPIRESLLMPDERRNMKFRKGDRVIYVATQDEHYVGDVISTIPILALFFSLQKSVMNGFAGGVKG